MNDGCIHILFGDFSLFDFIENRSFDRRVNFCIFRIEFIGALCKKRLKLLNI